MSPKKRQASKEASAKLVAKLQVAERQIAEGKLRDHEEVFSRLKKRVSGQVSR